MRTTPRLVAIDGSLRHWIIYLDELISSIGRQPSNQIVLADPRVSRAHCVIRNVGEQYIIEDLNSANGTYVNGERVTKRSLTEGSLIQVGASQFLFWHRGFEDLPTLSRKPFEYEPRQPRLEQSGWVRQPNF